MYKIFAITDIGKARKQNQDGFMVDGISCIGENHREIYYESDAAHVHFAIADGVGSTRHAVFTVEKMWEYLQSHLVVEEKEIERMIVDMNAYVYHRMQECGKNDGAATVAGIIMNEDKAYVYNIGDSLVFSINNGYLEKQTIEDTAQALFGGAADSYEEGIYVKPPLLQSIGTKQLLDMVHLKKVNGAKSFLVCSDGITDILSLDEIEDIINESSSLKETSQRIIDQANLRGGYDNSTIIYAMYKGE